MALTRPNAPKTNAPRPLRPRDAASLVVVDRSMQPPRILMGKRRPDQIFLPNKFVFPGGRVDRIDGAMPSADDLAPCQIEALSIRTPARNGPVRARAFALAAIRELFEETGLVLGTKPADPASGERTVPGPWQPFAETGFMPRLSPLRFFARAVTPPDRPRRYDTRFFAADACEIAHRTGVLDDELSQIGWYTLEEIRELDVASITRHIVEDIARLLDEDRAKSPWARDVPFYRYTRGRFGRTLLHVVRP